MSHQRTVYVIDDDIETRRSLTIQLAAVGAEAWPFASGAEFLEIIDHLMPACIVVDMDMTAPSGLELLAALTQRECAWPVIAVSGGGEIAVAVEAMKLGALDFLEKPVQAARLASALIPAWSRLEASLSEGEARRRAQEKLARLTPRELDIALSLFGGRSNKAVAHQFGISVRTVEMHRAHLMAKLEVKSLAEAAVMATHAGLAPGCAAPVPARAVPAFSAGRRPIGRPMRASYAS